MMSFIQPPLQLKPTFQEVQNWPTVRLDVELLEYKCVNADIVLLRTVLVCVCFAKVYEVAQGDNNTISFGNTVVTKTWHLASMAFDEAVSGFQPLHHQRGDVTLILSG